MAHKLINTLAVVFLLAGELHAQELKLELREELLIGGDESAPAEYLFVMPKAVSTDSHNNIYVADQNMSKIRVFDNNGMFIKSIGRKGRGPGEMQEVTSMVVDHNDDLIVVDRMSRRITRFSKMGEEFKTFVMLDESFISPWTVLPIGTERYLLYYRVESNSAFFSEVMDKIIHIYPKDFSTILESLASASQIWDLDQPFLQNHASAGWLNLCVIGSSIIVLVPRVYQGFLYLYEHKSDEWRLRILRGKVPSGKSYELLEFSDYPDLKFPPSTVALSGRGGRILARVWNLSRGVFSLGDSTIVHFSYDVKHRILGIELFEPTQGFLGYGSVKNISKSLSVMCKDNNGRLYCRSSKDGFAVIRAMRMIIDLK